ncbi:MAG: DUF924 family protein [Burkholderiales bacterium]
MADPDDLTDEQLAVLEFWLADGLERGWPSAAMSQRWFGAAAALDREINQRFGALVRQAADGGLTEWEAAPLPRLALVILLDQFMRNLFRGQAEAFAGDSRSQRLVLDALGREMDAKLPWVGRVFLLMPLMHAEDLALQQRCVQGFEALAREVPQAIAREIEGNLRFAKSHLEIIESYGRFPYRNEVLARASTEAELEFLKNGPRFGQ